MLDQDHRHYARKKCFACWGCIVATTFTTIILTLITGLILMSLLRSTAPRINLSSLSTPTLSLNTSSPNHNLLTADIDATFEVINENNKVDLTVHPLVVNFVAEDMNIGRGRTDGLVVRSGESKVMRVESRVVGRDIGSGFTEEFEENVVVRKVIVGIEVRMKGKVGVRFGGMRFGGLPCRVVCKGLTQSLYSFHDGPRCDVRFFSFG